LARIKVSKAPSGRNRWPKPCRENKESADINENAKQKLGGAFKQIEKLDMFQLERFPVCGTESERWRSP
jgi:hypothetical protein